MKHLWLIAAVFVVLGSFTTTTVPAFDEPRETVSSLTFMSLEVKKPNSAISKGIHIMGNHTSVSGWVKHNKKKAGLIAGVTVAVLIIFCCCCVFSKGASEKIKRQKKKKGGVLRGLRKFIMPKFKMPKLSFFKIQPKDNLGKEIKNIGSLHFSLFYEKRTTELFINIKKAEDLSLKSSSEVSFNFVEVDLDPFTLAGMSMGERNETKRVRNSVSPIFNDVITIKILPQELVDQTLICSVFDSNRISPRDLIGVVSMGLENVYKHIYGKEKDFYETLKWRSGERGGDILLGFRWNPRDEIFYLTVKECMNLKVADAKGKPPSKYKIIDPTSFS